MHRNTYLVVSILAVLAALVVGVNVGKKISPIPPAPTPTPIIPVTPTPQLQTFVDKACGFSLAYGNEFTLLDSGTGSAILNNATDRNKSIAMICQKNIPRPPIPADNIESLSIPTTSGASISAKLYHGQSSQNGSNVDAVIFTHTTNKLDIIIAGYGDAFNALIKTVQVLP